jgi:hypothetical protein
MTKRVLTLVAAMHITASVFINDDESGLHHDYEVWLEELAPHAPIDQYWHNRTGEDNADAHLKRNATGQFARDGVRGCCGGDQRPAGWFRFAHQNLWHLGADLSRPDGMAGPGVLTAAGGSGCWSR